MKYLKYIWACCLIVCLMHSTTVYAVQGDGYGVIGGGSDSTQSRTYRPAKKRKTTTETASTEAITTKDVSATEASSSEPPEDAATEVTTETTTETVTEAPVTEVVTEDVTTEIVTTEVITTENITTEDDSTQQTSSEVAEKDSDTQKKDPVTCIATGYIGSTILAIIYFFRKRRS